MTGPLMRLLSPGGSRARHQILIFHRVVAEPDPLMPGEPDRARFDRLIGALKRRFNILPLNRALDLLDADRLPPASLSITFDDGYADNAEQALPVLRAHGVSATFFVSSGFIDGGRMWNDTVIETLRRLPEGELDLSELGLGTHRVRDGSRAQLLRRLLADIKHRPAPERAELVAAIGARVDGLPDDLMMTSAQVRELAAAGMEIGGHTVSHPILTRLDDGRAREEIARGKAELEALLGQPVTLFAYPNGKAGQDYGDAHVAMARELGFRAAVTTDPGVLSRATDRWRLPRFTPWDRTPGRFTARLLMNRFGMLG